MITVNLRIKVPHKRRQDLLDSANIVLIEEIDESDSDELLAEDAAQNAAQDTAQNAVEEETEEAATEGEGEAEEGESEDS